MNEALICLDVGGTEIKGAVLAPNGTLLTELCRFPSHAQAPLDAILAHFNTVVVALAQQAPHHTLAGVRLAFPGPFDYENGICLLQGLAKYDALYGVNLRQCLAQSLPRSLPDSLAPNFEIRFVNDVGAFALGELHFGAAQGSEKAMFVCIGTGCGSAFSVGDRLAPENTPFVPPHGYLYDQPFRQGCIDDVLSRRGILHLSKTHLGRALDGHALAQEAATSAAAAACFQLFGTLLQEALTPFLESFQPSCLVLGGQITRSASLFDAPLRQACARTGVALHLTRETSLRTVQGLLNI